MRDKKMMKRFLAYINKVFDFDRSAQTITDKRKRPHLTTRNIFYSAFVMFVLRIKSLNQLEKVIRQSKRLVLICGGLMPSGDTIGRVFSLIDSDDLRKTLRNINHRLKRNKVLQNELNLQFAAVDGHELFSLKDKRVQ